MNNSQTAIAVESDFPLAVLAFVKVPHDTEMINHLDGITPLT